MTLALLLAFSFEALIPILIKLVIAALIAYVAFWGLAKIGLPEPFNKIVLVIIVLVIVIYCISLLAAIG